MNETDADVRHAAIAPPAVEPFPMHSPADIAEALGVSSGTVRRWIRDGKLRAVLVGGSWRVPASALEDFLTERTR